MASSRILLGFVHVATPCTFWGQVGGVTAVRACVEWVALRRHGGSTLDARHHDHALALPAWRRGILRTASSLHILEATADRGPLVAAWLATVHVRI